MEKRMTAQQRKTELAKALNAGWTKTRIARAIDTSESNLNHILGREAPNSKIAIRLENWLRVWELGDVLGVEDDESRPDVFTVVRDMLMATIKVLDSHSASSQQKARITLNQLEILVEEFGTQLSEMSKE